MKRILPIILLIVLSYSFLYTQDEEAIRVLLGEQIREEIQFNELLNQEILNLSAKIAKMQLLLRGNLDQHVKNALEANNLNLALEYFDQYCMLLDTLVVSKPVLARRTIQKLKELYKNVPEVWDRIYYYSGATNYLLNSYQIAEKDLNAVLSLYPQSSKYLSSLTLLLKLYLKSDEIIKAEKLVENNRIVLNNDQIYLAGHIYFILEKDSLATLYFSKIKEGKYYSDAKEMLRFLAILQKPSKQVYAELLNLYNSNPDNQFVLLSLARMSAFLGESDTELYYKKYRENLSSKIETFEQYEIALSYLQKGERKKAIELLEQMMLRRDIGDFYSVVLFLWGELHAEQGQINLVKQKTSEWKNYISVIDPLLNKKIPLMTILDPIVKKTVENPDISEIKKHIIDIERISVQLDSINKTIKIIPAGLPSIKLVELELYEKQTIFSLINLLESYILAYNLRLYPDSTGVLKLVQLEEIFSDQLDRISNIKNRLSKMNEEIVELALKNEIDANLEIYDQLLIEMNNLKNQNTALYSREQIDSLIVHYQNLRLETSFLATYYEYDNSWFKEIMQECDRTVVEINEVLRQTPTIKEGFLKNYSTFISERERKRIIEELKNLVVVSPNYSNSIWTTRENLSAILLDLEYNELHTEFVETAYYDKERKHKENQLSFSENQKLFEENQSRKQRVYDKIIAFQNRYPSFESTSYPSGYPIIANMANLYYELAELSYSLWQDNPDKALVYYRKVRDLDPDFYMLDAVLYNIAYLSSIQEKRKLEIAQIKFEQEHPDALVRPVELRNSENLYKESITAYKTIIEKHPFSPFYSESIYRLGYLYFEIGMDADKPIEYYQIAREYYNLLINANNDEYKYKGLYQRGWTWLFSSSEEAYFNSINDFVEILNAIEENKITDKTEVIDYTLASIKNIGYCLLGLDGTDITVESKGAQYTGQVLSKLVTKQTREQILNEAISQKLNLYMPMQAVDYMKVKIMLEPLALENPIIADSISSIYRRYPHQIRYNLSADSVYFESRENIVYDYGINLNWYYSNVNNELSSQMIKINSAFEDVERRYHNRFIDSPTRDNFNKFADLIQNREKFYTLRNESHPEWSQAKELDLVIMNIKLAKVTKNPLEYILAAHRIYKFNDKNPTNQQYLNLEGNAFDCVRVVYDSLKSDYLAMPKMDVSYPIPATEDQLLEFYQNSALRLCQALLKPDNRSAKNDQLYLNITLRQAEIARENRNLMQSSEYYQAVINFDGVLSNEVKRSVLINLAEIAELQKQFNKSENWYREAEKYALNNSDRDLIHQYALVQIQNNVDDAKAKGMHDTAASEYLRLADEFAKKDPTKSLQYKAKAQMSYLDAGNHRMSISLLIEIAGTKTKTSEILEFYRLAWTQADSLGYKQASDSLKHEFITKYPASYETYQLRLVNIDKYANNLETANKAGDLYLELYSDVLNKRIDSGSDTREDLLLAAIAMYAKADVGEQQEKLAEEFVSSYPNHIETPRLMEFIADKQLEKGNYARFEELAKTIYQKDKTRISRYSNVIKDKLKKIANDFEQAYTNNEWNLAFSKRDEFKKLHTSVEKDGLSLDFTPVYERFTIAESDYKQYQERIAFLKKYDSQLSSVENGFLKMKPGDLIRINPNTSWKTNLIGGKDNRINALKNQVNKEIKTVASVMESGAKYDLDSERRLRGLDLICRIYEYGAYVIKGQIDQYMKKTNEFAGYKKQFKGNEDELYQMFEAQKEGHATSLLQQAYPYYISMYRYFYLPGYKHVFTERMVKRLKELEAIPRYRIERINLTRDWQISFRSISNEKDVRDFNPNNSEVIRFSDAIWLNKITIPGNNTVVIRTTINSKVSPEYAFVNLINKYSNDSVIRLNGKDVVYSINPIDTLHASEKDLYRFALNFGERSFVSGENNLEFQLYNYDNNPMDCYFNLVIITDSVKIEAAMPVEKINLVSDGSWQYVKLRDNNPIGRWNNVVQASNFGFEKKQWYEMESSPANPIWIQPEDDERMVQTTFRKEFNFRGILRDGMIAFIAPENATVKLNDRELSKDYELNYDEETGLVFAGKVYLTPDMLTQGVNKLEITVNNNSEWKGLVTEITFTVAYPD